MWFDHVPKIVREAFVYNGAAGANGSYGLTSRFTVRCIRPSPPNAEMAGRQNQIAAHHGKRRRG
jgi:hypothetical protein